MAVCWIDKVCKDLGTRHQELSGYVDDGASAGGDACVLAAAFFYSLATVRLSRLAPSVPSLPLATAKSLALAGVSLIWLGASALNNVRPFSLLAPHRPASCQGCMLVLSM